MRGISAMVMSRVVMLIFLFTTFSIIIAFLGIVAEQAVADSAGVLAMQVRDAVSGVSSGSSLYSRQVIPLPQRLPGSEAGREQRIERYSKAYTIGMYKTGGLLSIAIAAGDYADINAVPNYISAFSLETGMNVTLPASGVARPSSGSPDTLLVVKRNRTEICLIPCKSAVGLDDCVNNFAGCR